MKQAHNLTAHKMEPKAKKVSETAVSQIGSSLHYKRSELYEGRGLEAPKSGKQVHKCGSQGRH